MTTELLPRFYKVTSRRTVSRRRENLTSREPSTRSYYLRGAEEAAERVRAVLSGPLAASTLRLEIAAVSEAEFTKHTHRSY